MENEDWIAYRNPAETGARGAGQKARAGRAEAREAGRWPPVEEIEGRCVGEHRALPVQAAALRQIAGCVRRPAW